MRTKLDADLSRFLVRLGATVAAVVLVMYLAKIWFVDQRPSVLPSPGVVRGQVKTSFPESPAPTDTARMISWQDAGKHYGWPLTIQERPVTLISTRITTVTSRR